MGKANDLRHLRDYVLHDIDGKCYEVAGTACGIESTEEYDWIWWNVFPKADSITCGNCRRTKDFKWVEEHPCCTAP